MDNSMQHCCDCKYGALNLGDDPCCYCDTTMDRFVKMTWAERLAELEDDGEELPGRCRSIDEESEDYGQENIEIDYT